ncbi:MAG: putative nucleotidyltransferase substrate binding domain-containing protein [Litorivicinaceae bacterium]|nr:putative nucleotidyltransferase substrate binding domain-containing protein [Litorivicinaceae bacterium]
MVNDVLNSDIPPFDLLSEEELAVLTQSLSIVYFDAGEDIIPAGGNPEGIYIIIKGQVEEYDESIAGDRNAQRVAQYSEGDLFGSLAVLKGRAKDKYQAFEECICHMVPAKTFLDLVHDNPEFRHFFHKGLATMEKQRSRMSVPQGGDDFSLVRIRDSVLRKPVIVAPETTIAEAVSRMRIDHIDSILVDCDTCTSKYGLVTGTDLLDALALGAKTPDCPVAEVATRDLITCQANDFLFNALIVMTRKHIKRVVITDQGQVVGVSELTDILSYLTGQTHLIGVQIEKAKTVDDLKQASKALNALIRALNAKGVKIRFMMELLAALNGRLVAKLFETTMPKHVLDNTALTVLGSEGRWEQIVKTDQDNALIIADGFDWDDNERTQLLDQFTEDLISIGFPRCPGNIMVSNPEWSLTVSGWKRVMKSWTQDMSEETQMKMAISLDGHFVAGNKTLFEELSLWAHENLRGNDIFLAHFAQPVMNFGVPLTLFGNVKTDAQGLDIKKGGIFPLVHGVRALALKYRCRQTNTYRRIEELVQKGAIHEHLGRNLESALSLFMQLRLQTQLEQLDESGTDDGSLVTHNRILVKPLNRLDRDLLREALHVIKEFKEWLSLELHIRG